MSTTTIDSRLGLINLSPDNTLGANLAWNVPSGIRIPVTAMAAALSKQGLPDYKPTGSTPRSRWSELVKNHKVSRALGLRDMRSVLVRDGVTTRTAYEFSVNAQSVVEGQANILKVGTLSIDDNNVLSWHLAVGERFPAESLEDYFMRALLAEPGLIGMDLADFVTYAEGVHAEVKTYIDEDSHSAVTTKAILKMAFEKAGGFSISSRGGFWFLPRVDGVACPYAIGGKVAEAVAEASGGAIRFTRMNIPKDAPSLEGAAEVVREDFLDALRSLAEEVEELESNKTGQNDGRRERVANLMTKVELYKTIWGMAGDDIEEAAAKAAALMDAHDSKTAALKQEREAVASVKADISRTRKEAKKEDHDAAVIQKAQTSVQNGRGIPWYLINNNLADELATSGRASRDVGVFKVSLRSDLSGVSWRCTREGVLLASGKVPEFVPDEMRDIIRTAVLAA
jgi:hypothetical protein